MGKDTTFLGVVERLFGHAVRSELLLFYAKFLVHLTVLSLVDLLLDHDFGTRLLFDLFWIN